MRQAQQQHARLCQSGEWASPSLSAKMSAVARAEEEEEEMRVRMRQAQRQMKGTKLQYIDQQPILFSDVAGVPGAKVRSPCDAPSCSLP